MENVTIEELVRIICRKEHNLSSLTWRWEGVRPTVDSGQVEKEALKALSQLRWYRHPLAWWFGLNPDKFPCLKVFHEDICKLEAAFDTPISEFALVARHKLKQTFSEGLLALERDLSWSKEDDLQRGLQWPSDETMTFSDLLKQAREAISSFGLSSELQLGSSAS